MSATMRLVVEIGPQPWHKEYNKNISVLSTEINSTLKVNVSLRRYAMHSHGAVEVSESTYAPAALLSRKHPGKSTGQEAGWGWA